MKGKFIKNLIILIFIAFGCYQLYIQLTKSPIKDPLLRVDILIELGLEEFYDDHKRPNKEDLKRLTTLTHRYDPTRYDSVKTLKGLQYAENLEELIVNYNEIDSIKPLENLTKLHTLNLSYVKNDEHGLFGLPERRIKDISPLKNLVRLKKLHLSGNNIKDLSVIENFPQLEELYITENGLEQLPEEIATLKNLKVFYAAENDIEDLTPLENLANLERINVNKNPIADFTPLRKARNLQELKMLSPLFIEEQSEDFFEFLTNHPNLETLHANIFQHVNTEPIATLIHLKDLNLKLRDVPDINFLAPLTQLEIVELTSQSIYIEEKLTSIDPLKSAVNMKVLKVSGNKIHSIEPLRHMNQLVELDISINNITSLEPIKDAVHLKKLHISLNPLNSLDGIENLTKLEVLYADDIGITSLKELENLTKLRSITLSDNKIEDLTPLNPLKELELVSLEGNQINDIEPLKYLPSLRYITLKDNPIDKEIKLLKELKTSLPEPNQIDVLDS